MNEGVLKMIFYGLNVGTLCGKVALVFEECMCPKLTFAFHAVIDK
jgi:hypothetical protein